MGCVSKIQVETKDFSVALPSIVSKLRLLNAFILDSGESVMGEVEGHGGLLGLAEMIWDITEDLEKINTALNGE